MCCVNTWFIDLSSLSPGSITVNGRRVSVTMCDTAGQVHLNYNIPLYSICCMHENENP